MDRTNTFSILLNFPMKTVKAWRGIRLVTRKFKRSRKDRPLVADLKALFLADCMRGCCGPDMKNILQFYYKQAKSPGQDQFSAGACGAPSRVIVKSCQSQHFRVIFFGAGKDRATLNSGSRSSQE
jgi:hypothetical protein